MSQSLGKLNSPYLPVARTSKSKRASPNHKYDFAKIYVISTKAANYNRNAMEKNTKAKAQANTSVEAKPKPRNWSNNPVRSSCDDGLNKLDYLNTRSLLARSGLLSLQQRLLQIELTKAMKNLDSSFIEELSCFNQDNTFEKPFDSLYEKYSHSGNSMGIRISEN
ncbi:unnamed protein product [Blepharisma stoltei]|uniref:Uncharacterized protein n=1 Tax=Blepharisma stoltei TaxID=1481888 RepID=A0AAU9INB1_9CILI|nr:unnamed protein product [Blepharisma stoltei]